MNEHHHPTPDRLGHGVILHPGPDREWPIRCAHIFGPGADDLEGVQCPGETFHASGRCDFHRAHALAPPGCTDRPHPRGPRR